MVKLSAILNKVKTIYGNVVFYYPPIKNPIIFMTLLVKDEEDIIRENLLYHIHMGVSYFVVTDNNSSDATLQILEEFYELGYIKKIFIEKDTNYDQPKWVDRMINYIKSNFAADWIINSDADEFWSTHNGDLKDVLSGLNCNVVRVNVFNMLPIEDFFYQSTNMIIKPREDVFTIFGKSLHKVIHRENNYKMISFGNHEVIMHNKKQLNSNKIFIVHYPVRNKEHFIRKYILTGKVHYENHKDQSTGTHKRFYYDKLLLGVSVDDLFEYFMESSEYINNKLNGSISEYTYIRDFFRCSTNLNKTLN